MNAEPAGRSLGHESQINVAGGGSRVGIQIGLVKGDVHQYYISDDEPPKRRYKVAIDFLNAGAASNASRLIKEAIEGGFRGDEEFSVSHVAYHWMLAILSGRSFDQLTDEDFEPISVARKMVNEALPNKWLAAHDVICRLLDYLRRQEANGSVEVGLSRLRQDYYALSDKCRDDFRRHLDPLLAGGVEEQLEADLAEEASRQRMSNGREARAWKFFEVEPEPPRDRPIAEPPFTPAQKIVAGLAAALGLAAAAAEVAVLQTAGISRAVIVSIIIVLSGIASVRSAVRTTATRQRAAAKHYEHGGHRRFGRYSVPAPFEEQPETLSSSADVEAREVRNARLRRANFVYATSKHVDDQFSRRGPRASRARKRWNRDTAALRQSLKREILRIYREPDLRLGSVDWLIGLRVREIERMWRDGTLNSYRNDLATSPGSAAELTVGLAAFIGTFLYVIITTFGLQPMTTIILAPTLLVAGIALALSQLDVYLVRRLQVKADRHEAQLQHKAEIEEYRRWVAELEDSPTDEEVARWLDYDKIYLKKLAMNQLDLERRDILAYATLTEPAPGSVGMRAPFAPRYSSYRVTVFLLTEAGVRQVRVTLDFRTGEAYNQVRRSFRYQAITSATVFEMGIRFDSGRKEPIPLPGYWGRGQDLTQTATRLDPNARKADAPLILRQLCQLRLMSGESITFLAESFDTEVGDDIAEDPIVLLNLAFDTSGIYAALELLEAISGHGAEWVRQRIRRRRRWRTDSMR